MDPHFRRRPVTAGRDAEYKPYAFMLTPDPSMTLPPPPLRFARSATNLRAAHGRPATAVADPKGELPVGFVVDSLPSLPALSPATTNDIRRVKSSSALSVSLNETENKPPSVANKWKHALGEAQYFAGGLVSRPAESTRHYSIIRHSHALVWYRGPTTSVSITILSDGELPPTRTVWLQQKGYSGNAGMSLKALMGTTGSWVDVTPATRAGVEHVSEVDERGIQRDLRRFAKKASGRQKKHLPRETHIVRIPASATDGYFRLVLCAASDGKKVLCGCPVFRIASTSTDVSVVKGASIRTMPLEVGVKVGSTVAQQFARKYTAPAQLIVQNRATKAAGKAMSNPAVKMATSYGKKATTIGKQVAHTTGMDQAMTDSWNKGKAGRYDPMKLENSFQIIGSDDGPEEPFPMAFEGKTVRGTGMSTEELGAPTANLSGVRDEVKMRWKGVYAAWACVVPEKGVEDISYEWHEALVTIGPLRYAPPEIVMKNRVAVHFLHDFDGATFFDMRVRVVLLGYLHPPSEKDTTVDTLVETYLMDSMSVMESLAREAWTIEVALRRERSFSERLDGVTGSMRGRVDRIPLHWAGFRSEGGAMRDRTYGNGGLWIPR